jgi:hypothetical protein
VLLPEGTELVALQSVVPGHPPVEVSEVEAVVCAEDLEECETIVPDSWELRVLDTVAYAVPPSL